MKPKNLRIPGKTELHERILENAYAELGKEGLAFVHGMLVEMTLRDSDNKFRKRVCGQCLKQWKK